STTMMSSRSRGQVCAASASKQCASRAASLYTGTITDTSGCVRMTTARAPARPARLRESRSDRGAGLVVVTRVSHEIVVEARRGLRELLDLRELWRCRELVIILAWRDIRARYSQTVLGFAWALAQPFALMLAFTSSFGGDTDPSGTPRVVAVYAGFLP